MSTIEDGLLTGTLNNKLANNNNTITKKDFVRTKNLNEFTNSGFVFGETSTIFMFETSRINKVKLNKTNQRPQSPPIGKKRVKMGNAAIKLTNTVRKLSCLSTLKIKK